METTDVVKKLSTLVQLDIDAIHAYEQAIEKIENVQVQDQLTRFKEDHRRHVENLSSLIQRHGGQAPEYSRDFKGFLIQGFTALRSVTGTEGALKAMKSNELLTNKTYDEALSWDLADDVKDVVKRNREDERLHLNYIEKAIESRVWEAGEQVA